MQPYHNRATCLGGQVADEIVELLQVGAVLSVLLRELHQRVSAARQLSKLGRQRSILGLKHIRLAQNRSVLGLHGW